MPRPVQFSPSRILDAASDLAAAGGPQAATMGAIAHAIGAPNGSLYHRFASRDELLGRLWLQKAKAFQDAFETALALDDAAQAAVAAALSIPRMARADLAGARIMLLYRREDFLSANWPPQMREEAERLGQQANMLLGKTTTRLLGAKTKANRLRVTFALLDVPLAAVRRHIAQNKPPPADLDLLVASTVRAILDLPVTSSSAISRGSRRRSDD